MHIKIKLFAKPTVAVPTGDLFNPFVHFYVLLKVTKLAK